MSTKKANAENAQVEETTQVQTIERVSVDFREQLTFKLEELNKKKKLADRRQTFIDKRKQLINFLENLDLESEDANFELKTAKISFVIKSGYRDDEQFSIAIPDMVINYVTRLVEDIDLKVIEIESELMTTTI